MTGRELRRSRCATRAVLWCLALMWTGSPFAQTTPVPDIDRAEQLSWMDAPAALQLLDKLQAKAGAGDELVQWLMVRGLAYIDIEPEQTVVIIRRLHELGSTQSAAEVASQIVQGYLYLHKDQYDQAGAQLKRINTATSLPAFARFRLEALRGTVATMIGRNEDAVSSSERLRDLASAMHSPPREFEALTQLAMVYGETGNLEPATTLVTQMRAMAEQSGDELQWVEVLTLEAENAEIRADRMAQRRALLEALLHARRTGSERSMAMVLIDLGNFAFESEDYAAALGYSTQALAAARKLQRAVLERAASYRMGMTNIVLGHLAQGKSLADGAIQQSLASGDLSTADSMMREYLTALEKAGDLPGALEVAHRDEEVRERLTTTSRQKVILELSAKFDAERRARQIELLQRDNTIKSRNLQAQRLRQQMIVMASALVVLACGALAWGIARIRRINARWVRNSQRDALTGLLNRGYFNEHILTQHGDRPYVGCLLLINLDHLQRINDSFGHAAGDGVLAAVGRRLAAALSDSDALVRWAGEEFLTLLGPMSEAQLDLVARKLLATMRSEPVTWNGHSYPCTVSIGYASFPIGGIAIDVSLDRAITLVGKALR